MVDLRELRDPIHGFIYPEAVPEIIDTPTFQRLRSIRQLALAALVYPGARHSRFEHSLGVMHLAGRIGRRFGLAPEDLRALCLAALLHDIGHGPFSHVSEDIVDRFYDRDRVNLAKDGPKAHEIITQRLIETDESLRRYLSDHDVERINGILGGTSGSKLLADIISGPLDCDKQDYLLRDSYYCGVKYGIYDIDRLVDVLEAAETDGDRILAVSWDGIHTLEQFALAKYYMTTQVYKHKVRLVTDAMIIRAIELGIEEDRLPFLRQLYRYDGSEDFLRNWVQWNDEALAVAICGAARGYARRMFNALRERRLHKQIYSQKIAAGVFTPRTRMTLSQNFAALAKCIEGEVGRLIGAEDPNLIIANRYTIKSVREQSRNEKETPIMVASRGGLTPFEEESMLFRSIVASEEDAYLEVYAPPPPGFLDEAQKKKLRLRWAAEITEIIEQIAKDYSSSGGGTRDDGLGGLPSNVAPCAGNDQRQDTGA